MEKKGISLSSSPTDILGTAKAQDYENAILAIKKNSTIFLILTPQRMAQMEETARMIVSHKKNYNFVCFFLGEFSISNATKILKKGGIKVYNTLS